MTNRSTVMFGLAAAADVALAASGRERWRRLSKPLLMPSLIVGRSRGTQRALALGWLGDVALLGAGSKKYGPAAFTAGLSAFLAGHLAWSAALRSREAGASAGLVNSKGVVNPAGLVRRQPVLAAPYLVAWAGFKRLSLAADGTRPGAGAALQRSPDGDGGDSARFR